jgi:aminopeptidase N
MPSLTHAEAIARAAAISVDAYTIDLDLTRGDRVYGSTTKINFTCTSPDTVTFLDVKPDALTGLSLDGVALDVAALADGRYPLSGLARGAHEVVVVADMAYTNTGEGLHRMTDPADGKVYTHATSFLDVGPQMFAGFDQPDLKAPVTMRVTADPEWTVAANGAGEQVAPGRWEFATTPPLATYFVTVVAGPYHVVRSEHDGIPLGILARASIAPHVDEQAAEIFQLTASCLDRFHELFGVRYPFGKYDHAFVPEFNAGAMENPGCVTYRDDFIFTSAVTDAEREERSNVIAHEMAHMWFGDLVTMRWWDDLWLNESFAEYLGMRITYEATAYTNVWTSFALGRKAWGYAVDQRPSTHPVASVVSDAEEALLNFDGISYAKGASVLRQLVAWLGDDVFFTGLRAHFAKHAYGNATLADLLDALSTASGRDLSEWARVWLRTPQVSTLRPEVTLDADGRYASVDVIQTAPSLTPGEAPVLRPHRINVAAGMLGADGTMALDNVIEVEVAGARTPIPALVGTPAADLLLLNYGDLTYAKIRLDTAGMANLARTMPTVTDQLTRALLWSAAGDATRDAELTADAYVDICAAVIPIEDNVKLLHDAIRYALTFAVGRYLPPDRRAAARARISAACRRAMTASEAGSGRRLAAARAMIQSAGPDDAAWMVAWLDGSEAPPAGLVLDSDLRWTIVARLSVLGAFSSADIDAEYDRDRTVTTATNAARAHASRPDATAKAEAWEKIVNDDTLSNHLLWATAEGFWESDQEDLTRSYVDRFVTEMPAAAARRAAQISEYLLRFAYPATIVEPAALAALTAMADVGDLPAGIARLIRDGNDDLRRALDARRTAGV